MLLSLGTEFMPPLDEGSHPVHARHPARRVEHRGEAHSAGAGQIIKQVPEVARVLGKAGRASTATDNSPMRMIETIILLKPRDQWRAGMTKAKIMDELNGKDADSGRGQRLDAAHHQPHQHAQHRHSHRRGREGVRPEPRYHLPGSHAHRAALEGVDGVKDLYVEPITGGKYLEIDIDRTKMGRYGLSIDDVNQLVESAIGGMPLTTTIEGRRRFSINARFAQDFRNIAGRHGRIPMQTTAYGPVPLSAVARLRFVKGPPMINSENALLRGAVLFNVRDRDLGGTVEEAMQRLQRMPGQAAERLLPGVERAVRKPDQLAAHAAVHPSHRAVRHFRLPVLRVSLAARGVFQPGHHSRLP